MTLKKKYTPESSDLPMSHNNKGTDGAVEQQLPCSFWERSLAALKRAEITASVPRFPCLTAKGKLIIALYYSVDFKLIDI